MSSGRIVQIIGAVIDVEFPREDVPKVYDALQVTDQGLTLEVQQQLGDGIVRTIAMGTTEGVKRGLTVANTGADAARRRLDRQEGHAGQSHNRRRQHDPVDRYGSALPTDKPFHHVTHDILAD